MRLVVLVLGAFGFERTPKTFHHRIIKTVALATHTQFQVVVSQGLAIEVASILTATGTGKEQPWRWLALSQGYRQGSHHQCAIDALRHRPADNPPGEEIKHSRQIQPALASGDIGDIDGMITNDKLCLSRMSKLTLTWSRYDVYLQRMAKASVEYPLDEPVHQGGNYGTALAHSATDESTSGRPTALGSGLPTAFELGTHTPACPHPRDTDPELTYPGG